MGGLSRAAGRDPARCPWSSGVEPENRYVQRLGRAHGVEVFAEEGDLAASLRVRSLTEMPVRSRLPRTCVVPSSREARGVVAREVFK